MRSPLLRSALVANALFSMLSGLTLVGFGEPVARWLGAVAPVILRLIGVGLFLFAAFLFWEARRPATHPARALAATLADLGWVAGSVVLLVLPVPLLSATGKWVVGGVAAGVLLFALLQLAGLRALTRNPSGQTDAASAFAVHRRVAAPAGAVWKLIRDLGRIGAFYPGLRRVEVDGDGLGARRTCEDTRGQRWSEDVVAWDETARAVTLRFDTEAPDFPFPVREMVGGWRVEEEDGHADVVVWYEFSVRGGLLGEFVAPLLAARTERVLDRTISNMEREANRAVGAGEPS